MKRLIYISIFLSLFLDLNPNFLSFAQVKEAIDHLKIVASDCSKTSIIVKCKIAVQNLSSYEDIKDVKFLMEYFAPSETSLGTDTETAYEIIPANDIKVVEIEGIAHSQAKRISVSIIGAKWKSE